MGIEITAKATGKESGEILIYGTLVDADWDKEDSGDMTARDFADKLSSLGNIRNLSLRINSQGGSVWTGGTIVSRLDKIRTNGCHVVSYIDGLAASMSSLIPHGTDEIIMSENALMMIHRPEAIARGNIDKLDQTRELLLKAEEIMVPIYMRHFKGTEDELRAALKKVSWYTAEEALAAGLCTSIAGHTRITAKGGFYVFGGLQVPGSVLKGAENKIKVTEEGEKKMFDEATQSKIEDVLKSGKHAVISKAGNSYIVTEMLDTAASSGGKEPEFLTAKQVEDAVGKAVDSEAVLNALKALTAAGIDLGAVEAGLAKYKEPARDNEAADKAAKYDQILTAAIDDALKNAVRAKGERYDEARERKILGALTYEEVIAQSKEWEAESKEQFHAGKRASVPGAALNQDHTVNIDDFKI